MVDGFPDYHRQQCPQLSRHSISEPVPHDQAVEDGFAECTVSAGPRPPRRRPTRRPSRARRHRAASRPTSGSSTASRTTTASTARQLDGRRRLRAGAARSSASRTGSPSARSAGPRPPGLLRADRARDATSRSRPHSTDTAAADSARAGGTPRMASRVTVCRRRGTTTVRGPRDAGQPVPTTTGRRGPEPASARLPPRGRRVADTEPAPPASTVRRVGRRRIPRLPPRRLPDSWTGPK